MQASKAAVAHQSSAATGAPGAGPTWLSDHAWWITALLLIAHAVAFRLSFPPANLWFLMVPAIALITLAAIGARRTRTLLVHASIALFVMWMLTMNWVMHVTAIGYPLMCVGMTLFGVAYALIIRTISRTPKLSRWTFAVVVPIVWTALECFRGEIAFHGYPWYFAAHPFTAFPAWMQSADLFGAYFISFLVAAASGAVIDIIRAWRDGISLAGRLSLFLVGIVVSINIGYGSYRMSDTSTLATGPRVVAIQTNLPQENKVGWTAEQQNRDFAVFHQMTINAHADALQTGPVDLIVWPETMLPGAGLDDETLATLGESRRATWFAREIVTLSRALQTPILVGSPAFVGLRIAGDAVEWSASYNAAYLIQNDPPFQRYDKFFLTPFGETMPYISAWPWLEEKLMAIGAQGMSFDLDAGPTLAPLRLELPVDGASTPSQEVAIATPICFEDSVGWVCRRMIYADGAKRADMLVNLSNDGWFGTSDGSRAHHLQVARFRCVENRVPMVRSVNTGFSASIDSAGRVVDFLGEEPIGTPRRDGWIITQVLLDSRHTLYARLGDAWGYMCLFAVAGMLVASCILRKGGRT
jgi:apolipoprotein N-acyltransferase